MPTVDIYSKQQVDALIAGAGGLPDPTSASAGDVLTLDSNKDPAWAAVPDELPSTGSASAGDVLALDNNKDPAWVAPSGGGSWHNYSTAAQMEADLDLHPDALAAFDIEYKFYSTASATAQSRTISQLCHPVKWNGSYRYPGIYVGYGSGSGSFVLNLIDDGTLNFRNSRCMRLYPVPTSQSDVIVSSNSVTHSNFKLFY